MNATAIGTTVGLGAIIGIRLGMPDATFFQYMASFLFYALISGGIFRLYELALSVQPPFGRR